MRTMIMGAAVAVLLLAAAAPAHAAPVYPWCAEYEDRGDFTCAYDSMQQCLDTARGSGGSCIANPFYRAPAPVPRPRKVKRKR